MSGLFIPKTAHFRPENATLSTGQTEVIHSDHTLCSHLRKSPFYEGKPREDAKPLTRDVCGYSGFSTSYSQWCKTFHQNALLITSYNISHVKLTCCMMLSESGWSLASFHFPRPALHAADRAVDRVEKDGTAAADSADKQTGRLSPAATPGGRASVPSGSGARLVNLGISEHSAPHAPHTGPQNGSDSETSSTPLQPSSGPPAPRKKARSTQPKNNPKNDQNRPGSRTPGHPGRTPQHDRIGTRRDPLSDVHLAGDRGRSARVLEPLPDQTPSTDPRNGTGRTGCDDCAADSGLTANLPPCSRSGSGLDRSEVNGSGANLSGLRPVGVSDAGRSKPLTPPQETGNPPLSPKREELSTNGPGRAKVAAARAPTGLARALAASQSYRFVGNSGGLPDGSEAPSLPQPSRLPQKPTTGKCAPSPAIPIKQLLQHFTKTLELLLKIAPVSRMEEDWRRLYHHCHEYADRLKWLNANAAYDTISPIPLTPLPTFTLLAEHEYISHVKLTCQRTPSKSV